MNFNMTTETIFMWRNSSILTGWENYMFNNSSVVLNDTTDKQTKVILTDIEIKLNKDICDYTYEDFCNANKEWCVQNGLTYKQPIINKINDIIEDETIVYQPKHRNKKDDIIEGETIVYQPKQRTKTYDIIEGETIVYQPKKTNLYTADKTVYYNPLAYIQFL